MGHPQTRPTAGDTYPDLTNGTQQASDHAAIHINLTL